MSFTDSLNRTWSQQREADWDNPEGLRALEAEIQTYLNGVGHFYGMRDEIRARVAELTDTPILPKPRYRSAKQERVAQCPRCGGR